MEDRKLKKNSKKIILLSSLSIIIVLFGLLTHSHVSKLQAETDITNKNQIDINTIVPSTSQHGEALYHAPNKNMKELTQYSELIVSGTTGSIIEELKYGIIMEFHVDSIVKGTCEETIQLHQTKSQYLLSEGQECVLALKKSSNADTYYISGGYQGLFSFSDNQILNSEARFTEEINELNNSISEKNTPILKAIDEAVDINSDEIAAVNPSDSSTTEIIQILLNHFDTLESGE